MNKQKHHHVLSPQAETIYHYEIVAINSFTEHVSQILLQPQDAVLSYQAGQYVNVLHGQDISPLSIACAPNQNHLLEFHLYHSPQNDKANDLLLIAAEEKLWRIQGPFGGCTRDKIQENKPIIFFAYNTGFAPVKAVIETLASSQTNSLMHLYWSVPRHHHFYLQSLLKEWEMQLNFKFTLAIRNASPQMPALQDMVLNDYFDLSLFQVYASGPQPFVHSALDLFTKHHLPRNSFYSDMV